MVRHFRSTLAALVALTALGSGCATPVSELATDTAGDTVAASSDGPRIRECRYAVGAGTNMRRRICHSQEEWAVLDARAAEDQDTDEFFRRSREGGTAAGNVEAPAIGGGGGGL